MKRIVVPPAVLRAALPVVTIITAVAAGASLGIEVALLVVAAGALLGVVALLWASVQALTGESPLTLDEAMTLGAPSVEEEQKRAVLRALKDLEFERSVGKIGEDDYAELSERYRTDAKRLMQLIDQGSQEERARAEKALQARLEQKPPKAPEPEVAPAESDPGSADADSAPHSAAGAVPHEEEEAT